MSGAEAVQAERCYQYPENTVVICRDPLGFLSYKQTLQAALLKEKEQTQWERKTHLQVVSMLNLEVT